MKIKIKPHIAVSETGLIFNPESGETYIVNPVGTELLRLFSEQKSMEDAMQILLEKFHTDAGTLERDCYDFVEGLQMQRLIDLEQ